LNLDKIKNALSGVNKQFKGKVVQVGLPLGKGYEDGTTYAYIAAIAEFGAPEQNIPPRPFFTPTIAAQKKKWAATIGKGVVEVREGNLNADQVLARVGDTAVSDLQAMIKSITSPPLAEATIRAKGFNKPLIDTGMMMRNIVSQVNTAGGDFTG